MRDALERCFIKVGLTPSGTREVEMEPGYLVEERMYTRYTGNTAGAMGAHAAGRLHGLKEIQAAELEMSFMDLVGCDMEPTDNEASKLALMRAQLRESNSESFEAESSEREEDSHSSGSDSTNDGDEQAEQEPVMGVGGLAVSDGRKSSSAAVDDGKGSSTDAEEAFRIDGILPSSFIGCDVAKEYTSGKYKGQTFHGKVEEFEIKNPGKNKHPVIFKVLFVEDQKYVLFNSRDLVRLLGPDKMEELKEKDKLKK
jgi:hypothetical protein